MRRREDNVFGWSALQAAAITELKPRTVQDWRANGTFGPMLEPRDRNHRIVIKHKGLYGALDLLRLRAFASLVPVIGKTLAFRVAEDIDEGFKDKRTQAVDLVTLSISQANLWVPYEPETYELFRKQAGRSVARLTSLTGKQLPIFQTFIGKGLPVIFSHEEELIEELACEGFVDADVHDTELELEGLGFLYPLSDVAGQLAQAIRAWIVSMSFEHSRLPEWMRITESQEVYDSDDWYMAFVEVDAWGKVWR